MKIDLEFAELHNPLFLAGTNLQMKLDPAKRQGLVLVYDRAEKELLVYYNNKVAIIPSSNVSSMTPVNSAILGAAVAVPAPVAAKPVHKGKINAQVSTPMDHVFGGEGEGKVR